MIARGIRTGLRRFWSRRGLRAAGVAGALATVLVWLEVEAHARRTHEARVIEFRRLLAPFEAERRVIDCDNKAELAAAVWRETALLIDPNVRSASVFYPFFRKATRADIYRESYTSPEAREERIFERTELFGCLVEFEANIYARPWLGYGRRMAAADARKDDRRLLNFRITLDLSFRTIEQLIQKIEQNYTSDSVYLVEYAAWWSNYMRYFLPKYFKCSEFAGRIVNDQDRFHPPSIDGDKMLLSFWKHWNRMALLESEVDDSLRWRETTFFPLHHVDNEHDLIALATRGNILARIKDQRLRLFPIIDAKYTNSMNISFHFIDLRLQTNKNVSNRSNVYYVFHASNIDLFVDKVFGFSKRQLDDFCNDVSTLPIAIHLDMFQDHGQYEN